MERIKKFLRDESGVVTMEYVVLGGIVIGALVAAGILFAPALAAFFTQLSNLVDDATTAITPT